MSKTIKRASFYLSFVVLAAGFSLAANNVNALVISTGDVTASEAGGLVPPPSTADPTIDGSIRIGDTALGQIDVTAGSTLQVNEFTAPIIGADGGLFSGARIHVGDQGQGTLNVSGGSVVNVSAASSTDGASLSVSNIPGTTTGGPSAAGVLNVNNSQVNVTSVDSASFNVGLDGSGTALFENGSSLFVATTVAGSDPSQQSAFVNVGKFAHGGTPSSSLTFDGTGTTATVNALQNATVFIGDEATGTLTVRNGASIALSGTRDSHFIVGDDNGGDGDLQIQSGGTVASRFMQAGDEAGSVGNITVTGAGSRVDLTGKDTVDGSRANLVVADEGTATMTVSNGGKVLINAALETGRASVITIAGSPGSSNSGNGTLTVDGTGSEVRLQSAEISLVQVGRNGTGVLNVQNGGSLIQDDPDLLGSFRTGVEVGSNGTVNVTGAGSSVQAAQKSQIGRSGTGALNITGGGSFQSSELITGLFTGSTGNVTVDGAGSTLNLLGIDVDGDAPSALIGVRGTSVVNVTNGGTFNIDVNGETITNRNGGFQIGGTSTSSGTGDGTLNVDGAGSSVNVVHSGASMQIGRDTTGTLNITNGGVVTNAAGDATSVVGREATATGTVNITGAGSQWQAGSNLFIGTDVDFGTTTAIGNGGQGTVNVANGGSLVATQIYNGAGGSITGGGGTITGNITNDGGTIGPGNSPGIMEVFGDVDLLSGSTLALELGGIAVGTGYDRLDVKDDSGTGATEGTVNIAAGAIFDIDFFGGFEALLGNSFDVLVGDDIVSAALTSLSFDFTDAALGAGLAWETSLVTFDGTREALRLTVVTDAVVSEPGSLAVFGLGVLGLAYLRRRKRI